jgi:alkyl hydroperoxide reductase subunit AhpC
VAFPADFDTQHWVDKLQTEPGFAQLQAQLSADFDRMVGQLLDADPRDAALAQRLIGELRGIRYAQQTPSRIARLAREAT